MTVLVPISLYGWVFLVPALFAVLPARRAALAAYLGAWMFLPYASIPFSGIPDLDKVTATGYGVVLGVLMFDAGRIMQYRFSWIDLPIIVWCLSPMASSLSNGLGAYDGFSGIFGAVVTWGIPYFIGRLYFNEPAAVRELAIWILVGGLIYVPLCLWEIRMSPQLHRMLYGFHPTPFEMTIRFGGYRPMVFMQHGLMVGMWMTATTLVAFWLWWTGALRHLFRVPMWLIVGGMVVTCILCKSTGAILLLFMGMGLLLLNQRLRSTALLVLAVSIAPAYMAVRAYGMWDGQQLVELAELIDEDRASSLSGRLYNEDLLLEKAALKPIFGWGSWGRWRVYDEVTGKDITVSDGMWVIVRGERGLVGLVSITFLLLLPFLLLLRRCPARQWSHPMVAAPAALAMLLMLYSIDNLLNAMLNPIFVIGAGALSGFYLMYPAWVRHVHYLQMAAAQAMQAAPALRGQPAPATS